MQKYLSFFVLLFSFISLFGGWGADLCEEETCSGHGECQEDGENEWCECDEGYIASGLDCILGCSGVTCSGHGVCSVVSGAEVCTCEAGFHATGLNCILNEASTMDTLAILNGTDCYNTGNCHYRLIFATGAYDFTPALSSLYDIIINVLDSENVWHNYRKTVTQCVTEGVCDNVDSQYIDFWFQHNVNGSQYVTVELLGNGDDAYDDMYHDVLIDYCYGVNCGTGGTCDGTSGHPVCSCEEGYVLRGGICEEGWFEDENLAAVIVELLQFKGYEVETEADITPEMLSEIEYLALRHKNISSLVGIEHFSSLSVLDISENNISDLSPLAECPGLTVLNMSGNPANDLNPLSGLPLVSLDISYSGVYNLNPLVSVSSLKEIVLADTAEGRHGIIRPENTNVAAWLEELELDGCNELILFGQVGYRYGIIGKMGGCPAHGSCVNGICLCDEGYRHASQTNTCFDPNGCDDGFHINTEYGICVENSIPADCPDDDPGKKFQDASLEWNGSDYTYPGGFTTEEPCLIGDTTCDNTESKSVCRWECKEGYMLTDSGRRCVPFAEREISASAYNRLLLPDISRQDAALEPIPGVPSLVPVLRAEFDYKKKKYSGEWHINLVKGWHLDIPRVELNTNANDIGHFFSLYEWDQKKVYVYMPWGKEEYSIETDKKCFNSDNNPVDCQKSSDIDRLEITYYPAAGQNLFSYIVLETTNSAYVPNFGGDKDKKDWWKVTRYGEDGTTTEFSRNYDEDDVIAPRPSFYRFMDYIPIVKHTTRDKKETSFYYTWGKIKYCSYYCNIFYYILRSVTIVDPLKRVIKIESYNPDLPDSETQEFGLMGRPDNSHEMLHTPLEGNIDISVGKADSEDEITGPLKKVATYSNIDGFSMNATIYKDEHPYRTDSYFVKNGIFYLESERGQTTWDIDTDGYTEKRLVRNDEYIVKTVSGSFVSAYQFHYPVRYSLSSSRQRATTVYGTEKNGVRVNERIVEDYFTNWAQPAKRVTCKPANDNDEDCTDNATSVTEEIKYNVSGSPIYFKNADGQVTVNLYETGAETNAENYNFHFYADPHTYNNYDQTIPDLNLGFVRADNLRKTGTPVCSVVYSLDTQDNFDQILLDYVRYGLNHSSSLCSNTANSRVTNYEWTKQDWGKPYDLQSVTYPDGKTRTFTYDYDIGSFFQNAPQPSLYTNYTPNGKVWGETITGSNSQNTLQTCYAYDINYQLAAQGIGPAGSGCDPKKGFDFDSSGLLMTQDFSYNGNTEELPNDYIYDSMGRKLAERNSAGVSTLYVYDGLDRVVFTFFGCELNNNNSAAFETRVYEAYNFEEDGTTGENGLGATFRSAFPYNDFSCEYYRKYKYDVMSNLTETYFFEYWGINSNNQVTQLDNPKIIKQETEYDFLDRAVKSCQFDVAHSSDKRCIETEHDAFGNIVKKEEAVYDQNNHKRNDVHGETREITYDYRNRPLTVTVDGLLTEEYSYHNETCGTYCGYDEIANKYGTTSTLKTYKDKWGRAAKSVDPFGNNVEPHYNSTTWLTDYSKTYNGATLTSFDAYEYDDLGRISTVKKVLFDPASNTSNAAATSISGIAAKEMVLEKSVSYDPVTGSVVSVEDSFGNETVKVYDSLNRVVKVENYDADSQLVSSVRTAYDTTGRISAVQDWISAKTTVTEYEYDNMGRVTVTCVKTTNAVESQDCLSSSCNFDDEKCSYSWYNTGGQVMWSADTETGGITNLLSFLNIDLFVGNETVYDYNAFGEVVKTARRMTASGSGGGLTETQLYNSDAWITTNYTYDIFGRNTEKADDNGAKTYYTYTANNLPATEKYCGSDDSDCDDPREVTYTYNTLRDLVSETYEQDNVSLTVNYGRDDYGRISQKYTGNTATDVYQTFTYNNRNLLETAKSVDPTNTTSTLSEVTRTYDSFGNIKSETFDSGTVSSAISWNPTTKVMSETITLPSGKNIVETTLKGLPKTLEYDGTKLLQYNYGSGNVLSSIRKNFDQQDNHSAELSYTYNNWRKVSRRKEEFTAQNAPTVADYEYTYSKGLHLIGKQENEENRRTAYQYDSYYRLRRVDYDCAYSSSDPTCANNRNNVFKCNAAETDCEDFQLDGVHNIRSSYENQTNFAWTVDGFNRLEHKSWNNNTTTYSYDSNNNMIGEDFDGDQNADITYTYDKLNRLTSVTNSDYLVEYSYDPFNRRTEKTIYYADGNDTFERTHKYAYNDWDIISEEIKTLRTSDNPVTTTVWELRRYVDQGTDNHIIMDTVSCSDDGNGNCSPNEPTLQRTWFHKDERGNVIAVSDGNGTIYERYRYRVYGEHEVLNADFTPKTTAAISPFLWGGSLYEPETNLYWMRNRYYHIDMHRFINQDPIGIWGDANNLGNGFAYVAGMVIEASDPTGLISQENSYDIILNTDKEFYQVRKMTEEERIQVIWWTVSALVNVWGGWFTGMQLGAILGTISLGGEIATDTGRLDPNLNFALTLTTWKIGLYSLAWQKTKLVKEAVVFSTTKDIYYVVQGFAGIFNRTQNSLKEHKSTSIAENMLNVSNPAESNNKQKDIESPKEKTESPKEEVESKKETTNSNQTSPENNKNGSKETDTNPYDDCDMILEYCVGCPSSNYPSDPDKDPSNAIQKILMSNILAKMLKRGESEQPPFFTDTSTGPNGAIMIYHNPYYINKDPLKTILFNGDNGSGKPMIYRNPLVPGAEYWYNSTTYEKWQQSGFPQTNVDPYFD